MRDYFHSDLYVEVQPNLTDFLFLKRGNSWFPVCGKVILRLTGLLGIYVFMFRTRLMSMRGVGVTASLKHLHHFIKVLTCPLVVVMVLEALEGSSHHGILETCPTKSPSFDIEKPGFHPQMILLALAY